VQMGKAHGKPALAVTFEPHPRSFFAQQPAVPFNRRDQKLRLLRDRARRHW
jgi:riboflavin kinase/FMN adenylyltransferase